MSRPALILAAWTLFVWGVRIKNADGSIAAILLSVTFVGLAVVVLATKTHVLPTLLLAVWTIVVWLVRLVDILVLSDHAGAFKVVHAGLGVVSIVAAAACGRALDRSPVRRAVPG